MSNYDGKKRVSFYPPLTSIHSRQLFCGISIGIYYTLAAWQKNRNLFCLTVLIRPLTSICFWIEGGSWKIVSTWEGGVAVLIANALIVRILALKSGTILADYP